MRRSPGLAQSLALSGGKKPAWLDRGRRSTDPSKGVATSRISVGSTVVITGSPFSDGRRIQNKHGQATLSKNTLDTGSHINATLQAPPIAAGIGAQPLSCLSRGSCMLCARPLLRVPRGLVRHPGMENRQELAHAGRQRDFRRVASRSQALVQSFAYRVLPHRATRTHGHAGPDMGATTPTGPGAPQGPLARSTGAPPTRAAMRWRFNVPHSGRSSRQVRGHTGPLPGTLGRGPRAPARLDARAGSCRSHRPARLAGC